MSSEKQNQNASEIVMSLEGIPSMNINADENSPKLQLNLLELWSLYSEYKKPTISPSTYATDYRRVKNHITKMSLKSLEDTAAVCEYLVEKMSFYSAKRCFTFINACCKWAVEEGLIETNAFASKKIKESQFPQEKTVPKSRKINPFTKSERDLIIQTIASDRNYSHYTNYVRFLFFAGCRPSEAIGLQWKHIGKSAILFEQALIISEDGWIIKKGLKRQKCRNLSISPELQEILNDIKASAKSCNPEDYIFRSPQGEFLDQRNFAKRVWKPALKKCGVPYRKNYLTRHTFITLCAKEKTNSTIIGRWTGTSTRMIDEHYAATNFEDVIPPDLT